MTYLEVMAPESPTSILSMTRGKLLAAVQQIPEDIAMMTEKELRRQIKPTSTDYCLRTSFWREYEAAIKANREHITTNSILGGICSDAYFYQKFLKDEYRVAWLVTPVQTYMKEIEAVLVRGTQRLWELMEIDIEVTRKDGSTYIDPKLAAVLLDAIKMVEARAKGHAMLRQETRSLSVNLNAPRGGPPSDQLALAQRMKELSQKIHGAQVVGVGDLLADEAEFEELPEADEEQAGAEGQGS